MPCGRLGGFLTRRAHGGDLEIRQRLQRRDMRDRGKSALRIGPDDADADFIAAGGHDFPSLPLGDGAARVEALDMPALGSGRRVDDGIDEGRLSRRERVGQSLGEAGRVGRVVAGPAERLDYFLVVRVAEEAGRRV